MTIDILVNIEMPQGSRDHLAEHYAVHYWPDPATHGQLLEDPVLKRIRGVQTNGSFGLKRPFIEAMPRLEIICAIGAGFEGIDLAAAAERGIPVTNGSGANAPTVADHAFALLLGVVRRVPEGDRAVREGRWREARDFMPVLAGRKMGIFGLGHIGLEVAKRALGFDMEIGYRNRRPRDDLPFRYFDSLTALAGWSDALMITAPGGAETYHAVDGAILDALGPDGVLVNVGRGSVVDSAALVAALRDDRIAGAALDVIEGEPAVPPGFLDRNNLVLSPHVGSRSRAAMHASIELVRRNMDARFAGRPVLTPVSG